MTARMSCAISWFFLFWLGVQTSFTDALVMGPGLAYILHGLLMHWVSSEGV